MSADHLPAVPTLDDAVVGLPVTAAQSEILLAQQLDPRSTVYNLSLVVEATGPIDVDRAAAAIRRTVAHAEALHVRFRVGEDRTIRQVSAPNDAWPLEVVDVRDAADPEAAAQEWMDRDLATVVDVTGDDALFGHALIRLADDHTVWYQRYHHSIIDGFGISLIVADMVARYDDPNLESTAGPWVLQDLIDADVDYRSSARFQADRDYWLTEILEAPEPPQICAAGADPSAAPESTTVTIDGEIADAMYAFASAAGIRRTRLPMALIVAYLHRISGLRALTLSVPMAARVGRAMRRTPGMASTILPVTFHVDPAATVGDLARTIDARLVATLRHGRFRGEDLAREVRAIDPDRRVFGPGINSMMFEHVLEFDGNPARIRGSVTGPVQDLDFSIQGGEDGEPIRIDLRAPAGRREELLRHEERLAHFVTEFLRNPTATVGELEPMTDDERRRVLFDWNDTAEPQPSCTVPDLFADAVRLAPDAEALVAGDRRLTYRELSQRVAQLAHHLRGRGLSPEEVVAVGVPRSAEMVVGLLAVLCAGGAFVPLDPSWPRERRDSVLADAGARLILTGPGGVDAGTDSVPVDLADWAHGDLPTDLPDGDLDGRRLAYVIFTSGSTGRPKGAMIRHEAICARLLWQRERVLGFGADDASLFKAPLSFDISVNEILLPLVSGGRLIVAEPGGERDPQYLLDLIARERVTFVYLVSSMLDILLDLARDTDLLSGLRHVWCGGEVLTPDLFDRFRHQLSTTLYHGYGPAEATIGVSHVIYRDDAARIATSIGRPNPNTQLYVLDSQLRPVPEGIGGELYAGGYLLGRGYVGAPGLTASRFVANPFSGDGSRLYRTGDLARWSADGSLDFLGRADNQVKIRGMRLELEDVEAALASNPAVRHCAVLVRKTPAGANYLAAYVVPGGAGALDADMLRAWASDKLPEYMVPSAFVVLDAFPLTPNGKLDRRALPEPDLAAASEHVEPRTELEATLAGLIAGVLGLEQVGVTDDFFALGGDSIVAIALVNQARHEGFSISARDIFQLRTAAALAAALDGRVTDAVDTGDVAVGAVDPSPVVARVCPAGADVRTFHQWVLLQTPADLDEASATAALQAVVAQHDALRARWDRGHGTLTVPESGAQPAILVTDVDGDLDAAVAADRPAVVELLDPEAGIMVQAALFRRPGESGRLLLVGHHLVVDAVSWRIVVEDFARAATALLAGASPDLPAVGTSLRRWAQLLEERARAGAFDDELGHWRAVTTPGALELGARTLDPAVDTWATAGTTTVETGSDVAAALLTDVPGAYHAGVADVLVAALALALRRWRDDDAEILLDLEGHGREEDLVRTSGTALDVTRTVGWFTTVYPVRLAVPGDSVPSALRSVKEQLRRIPNRGFGYGALRYLNDSGRDLEFGATAPVLFNYLGRVAGGAGADWLPTATGGASDPAMPLGHALTVDVLATDGPDGPALHTTFTWAGRVLSDDEIAEFTAHWNTALRDIAGSASHGGHTPSDFPLVSLEQNDVDRFAATARTLSDILPTTPLQDGIYFHSVYERDGASPAEPDPYVVQQVVELSGEVDAVALHRALQGVVDRHDVLRAALRPLSDGRVVQVISARADVPMTVVDLSTDPDPTATVDRVLAEDRLRGFDFERPPLVRYMLARVEPGKFLLLQSIHHVVADGWSVPVMLRELLALYSPSGTPLTLPAPAPYRNYLTWLASRDRGTSIDVWQQALAGAGEPPALPGVPAAGGSGVRSVVVTLPSAVTSELHRLGRERGLTTSTLVHGAWGLLLARLTGRRDVLFGSTVSGRGGDLPGIESMVGLFINTVPARLRLNPDETTADVLARWQSEQSALLEHQYVGLGELRRVTGLQELFQTLVVVENYPIGDTAIADPSGAVSLTGIRFDEHPPYPLTLIAVPGGELRLEVKYDAARVSDAAAAQMADGMLAILSGLPTTVDGPVAAIALADGPARTDCADPVDFPATTVTALLDAQAVRAPDATAVVCEGRSVSYAQLHDLANRLAHVLVRRGVQPETKVAVALPRSIELMVALLAIGKAGGAYVPLDTGYPAERLAYMLEDSAPVCVLTSADVAAALPDTGIERILVDDLDLDSWPADPIAVDLLPQHPVYVIYTSGSTGRPKGVVVPHAGVVNRLLWMQTFRPILPADRVLQKTPSSFDVSVPEFFGPLLAGATLVLARPDGHRDPEYLAELIVREGITRAHFVPSMLELFLDEPKARACTGLRVVAASGEALPLPVVRRFADVLPGAVLDNLYGPTEASVEVSCADAVQALPADATTVPIGLAVANTALYVLDPYLQPVADGAAGELYVAGPQLARGYLGRPGASADRFVADPFGAPGDRKYRTGDVVRRNADGAVEYLGRADDQVKLRGYRIELGEIESRLAAHPDVTRAAAVVREDVPGHQQLVGYLVAGSDVDVDAVRRFAGEALPEFMIPTVLVVVDALPLSPSGKLDRRALPVPAVPATTAAPTPAGRASVVAGLVAEVLGRDAVGEDDDFFALGGDSILAIRLVNLARREGLSISPRQIFEQRTARALARLIGDADAPAAETVPQRTAVASTGDLLPMPVVHRLSEWSGGTDRFNQAALLHTPADLSIETLTAAVRSVLDHHDGLRQRLTRHAPGVWSLHIAERGTVTPSLRHVDVAGLDDAQLRAVLETESSAAADRLDPESGAVIEAVWFDAGEHDLGRLLVVAHHLVVDGVSWRVLLEDLPMAWVAARAGETVALDPVGTSLREYADLVTVHAQRPTRLRELDHWVETTAAGAELVPTARGDATIGTGASRTVRLSVAATEAVLTAVPALAHADVTDVLVTALRIAVTRWFAAQDRASDLLVDLERHGREDLATGIDLSRTVGWFTNIAPVRLPGGTGGVDALKAVKEALRAAPDGGIGYGMLRYANARTAGLLAAGSPAQVLFNYLGRMPAGIVGPWTGAPETDSLETDPDTDMGGPYRLIVNALCEDTPDGPVLSAVFGWSEPDLSADDARAIGDGWVDALRELVEIAARHDGPVALTPSDVPLAALTQQELDVVVAAAPGGVETIWPLSPLQEGLYFQAGISDGADIYTAQFSLDFDRRLDLERLAAAMRTLQRRNPTLRAGFVSAGLTVPVQFVGPGLDVPITEVDLRDLDDAAREERAAQVMREDRLTPFDLTAPPLWRATVLRLGADRDRLVINRQFLLWDGWSNGLVVSQLLALYETGGDDTGFVTPDGGFDDYLSWLAARDGDAARAAWQRALGGLTEPTLLARQTGAPSGLPDRRDTVLARDLGERLREQAARAGVTFNAILSAALGLVLAGATGRSDVVFGTTVAGRPPEVPGLDSVVGMFLNTVPVRMSLRPNESVADLLRRTQADRLELMPYDYLGLAAIQRTSAHRELFDVLYVLQNFVDETQVSALHAAHDISGGESIDHTHYPLTVVVTPGAETRVKFEFHPDRVAAADAERMLASFVGLLERLADDVDVLVGRTSTLTDAERALQSSRLVETAHPLPEQTIADLFAETAQRIPDATALVFGDDTVTYADLDARINRMARVLLAFGAGPEEIVALALPRSVETVVALFAVLRTGSAYLPLELDHPAERLVGMLDDARPITMVTTAAVAETLSAATVDAIVLDDATVADTLRAADGSVLGAEDLGGFAPGTPGRLDHPAYVIYTSGSTGRPKGVVTPYRGLTNMQLNHREAIFDPAVRGEGGRTLRIAHTVSFAFDMSWEELLWLVEGHEVHICDEELRRDARALVAYGDEHGIDVVNVTPTYARHLLDEGLLDGGPGRHRPPLVLLGGEAVSDQVWDTLRDTDGTCGYNLYGPTEYTINTLGGGTADSVAPTVGRPIRNTVAHILDGWLRPVADGVPGELYISGVGLARGYLDRFGLTAERFVADPVVGGGARMYRTGDLVRRAPDGNIDFLGRTDDQVKIRGHRVELGEVESVLAAHESVRQAAVVADTGPGGLDRLVAYVVPARATAADEVTSHARKVLPDFMVPAAVIAVDALPMTVNGKLDVRALPSAESVLGQGAGESREPRDGVEEALCRLFGEVLELEVDLGIDDNFFDLGGHSLLATRLISRARAELAAEVTMRDLFEAPTVAELAQRISGRDESTRPALVAGARPEHLPLSPAQQRLWVIQQIEKDTAEFTSSYNFPIVLRLRGDLDSAAFTAALADVVARHEVLRTVFGERGGEPVQVIRDAARPDVTVVDAAPEEVPAVVAAAVARPFDLATEIPLRATVIRVGKGEQVLALVLHHIATDEWSDRPFLRDLMVAYAARSRGTAPEWSPLPVQYADFTLWQRALLGDPSDADSLISRQLDYWSGVLDGAPEEVVLPVDRTRPARPSFAGGAIELDLDAATTRALRTLARAYGASMFMVLHAASAALLQRLGAGDDLPLGAPVAGRTEQGLDDLVGFFVNTVVLRTDVSGDPTFADLLARVKDLDLAAFSHADVPFESVVERLNPTRTLARNPLFQVMVGYHSRTADPAPVPDLTLAPVSIEERTAKFDLVFNWTEFLDEDRVRLRLEYSADLFERDTVDRMARRQLAVLAAVSANPAARISDVDVFLDGERVAVLREFNDTARPVEELTLPEAFDRWVRETPNAIAVADRDGAATFAELDKRSRSIAAVLATRGVRAESVVGLAVPRSIDMVASVLGVLRLGAAYLPLDLTHPADRISYMLEDSGAEILLSTESESPRVVAENLDRILLDDPRVIAALYGRAADELPAPPAGLEHAAYVIYTSGSTGRPKGAVLPHEGIMSLVATAEDRMKLTTGSVVMQFASVGFDVAVFELSMALCTGSTLAIIPEEARVAGPELTDFMHERKVTHAILPPSLMAALPPGCSVPEGCTVLVGTETVPPDLIGRWAERLNLLAAYGLTEATVNNTLWQAQPGWTQAVPIGIPDPNEQAYVLDDRLRPVPPGIAGELYIAGRGLARGYLGRPDLTAGRFVANPFGPGRMYRTGDRARWRTDGNIDFLGRADDQVKIRGFRIELGEIIAALASHPSVSQAAVVADRDGEITRLVGYVSPEFGDAGVTAAVDPSAVRAHAAQTLPDYMVPTLVVALPGALPLTPNGKLDRRALPAPDWATLAGDGTPRDEVETELCEVVSEVLHLPAVGIHDGFFDLGGHSMAAMKLVGRVRSIFEVDITIRDVFDAPTVAELAEIVRSGERSAHPAIAVTGESGPVPLAPAQRMHWQRHRSSRSRAQADHALALQLQEPIDPGHLARALDDVVDRHVPLRTVFASYGAEVYASDGPRPGVDVIGVGDDDLHRRVFELAQLRIDLTEEPPLRVHLVSDAAGHQVLLLTMHYVAVDEWSVVALLGDLLAAYVARAGGAEPEWTPLAVQYPDYVRWQTRRLGDPADPESLHSRQLAYWRNRLADMPSRLHLPASAGVREARRELVPIEIDADLHGGIDRIAARTGTSMFMVLQAALASVLTRSGAGKDIPIGSFVAGRSEDVLAPMIGCFFNVVVMRTDTSGDPDFDELLARIRVSNLEALEHQDVGFADVAAEIGLRAGRLPQVLLVHHEQARFDALEGVLGGFLPVPVGMSTAELALSFYEPAGDGPVHAYFEFSTGNLDQDVVGGWARELVALLRSVM